MPENLPAKQEAAKAASLAYKAKFGDGMDYVDFLSGCMDGYFSSDQLRFIADQYDKIEEAGHA